MLTYGDGLCDVNIKALLKFHKDHGKIATVTTIQPAGKFGVLQITDDSMVDLFTEKPKGDGNWINGGFFVLEPKVFDYLEGNMDEVMWEQFPLTRLASDKQLVAFKHFGFWKAMDTYREMEELNDLWTNKKPWAIWEKKNGI